MKKSTVLSLFSSFLLCAVCALFAFLVQQGNWLQTDLQALLPEEQGWQPLQVQADQKQEARFNQQLVAMVGHQDAQQAFQLAEAIAQQWQKSGLFSQITDKISPDLVRLQSEINTLKFATLPAKVSRQLLEQPERYFQHYAEQIVNPFEKANLLSIEQDWLGFGRFVLGTATTAMQWNVDNGMLYTEKEGITWVLLRGQLAQADSIKPTFSLLEVVDETRVLAKAKQAGFLVTGAALFAADAKQKAESESHIMTVLGMTLILFLLAFVFRTWRIVWLFLPILMGMLSGLCAVILVFGQVHILTIVIGTSLVGVLIDFPLHWLASSLFAKQWQAKQAMQSLGFTFLISLLITLVGYALLGFTHLPILKQTALFSIVALVGAMLTTMFILPSFFQRWQAKSPSLLLLKVRSILTMFFNKPAHKLSGFLLAIFTVTGIYQTQWRDDIRQWIALPEQRLNEAQKIAQLAGINLSSQYLLVTAENNEALLQKERELTDQLFQQGFDFQALSQWLMPEKQQRALGEKLSELPPASYEVMAQIGMPVEEITQAIEGLKTFQPLSLENALQTHIGQGWQTFYLGKLAENQVASLVQVKPKNGQSASEFANGKDIFWQDKRDHLNEAFEHTRDQAAWLKLLSFILVGGLLWKFWGLRNSLMMLLPPLFAILMSLAVFGWLGFPVGLFSLFGLLLVSAIGVDYTAYMQTAKEPLSNKRIAILLSALTTLISFMLLGMSSTPAVAMFGFSVSLGVLFSVAITFKLFR
ncbi:MMPL family transporter [Rodentibacter heidelbergensis]|uniref:Membrane transport protein MMPL domain-containing protein n=1 Tax=Rodentibacter heidelbergensis TaxID=1908258 RepID=A0A1V3IAF4_9PAST|nr:MMPL family transporter [Rodentibacter heidelbergensis]OOF36759.1 hypothetical protein BKK48_04125 [Rodentibacter heidelbergensis]